MQKSITQELSAFIDQTNHNDIAKEQMLCVKSFILDFLGCALRGSKEPEATTIFHFIKDMGGKEEASIIGSNLRSSCTNTALANGYIGHILELDDISVIGAGHPGIAVIPAALSIGESIGAESKQIMTAIALGYEVYIRVDRPIVFHHRSLGIHSAWLGAFGAAAAAGKLLGLSEDELTNALGICTLTPTTLHEACSEGGMVKNAYGGWASLTGIYAAQLAKRGITGPRTILEGDRGFYQIFVDSSITHADQRAKLIEHCREKALERLGQEWLLRHVGFKTHASCGGTHSALDCVLTLLQKHDIKIDDIKRVVIEADLSAYNINRKPRSHDSVSARFSLPYQVSIAVNRRRKILPEDFRDESLNDPDTLDFMKKVIVKHNQSLDRELRRSKLGAIVTIKTKAKKYTMRVTRPREFGRLTFEEITQKFKELCCQVVGRETVDQIVRTTSDFERFSVGDLMHSITVPEGQT